MKGATENKRQVGHFINTGIQNMERSKFGTKKEICEESSVSVSIKAD